MSYTPSEELLNKYADLLINFALGGCQGIKPGEVVWVRIPEAAKPLFVPLRNTIIQAGGIPLMHYLPNDVAEADEYNLSTEQQISFFLDKYYKGIIDQVDHMVYIIAETNKYELQDVDPHKILLHSNAMFPFMQWRNTKESAGKFTWTIGLYGTQHMAKDMGISERKYWNQIIKACYLDAEDPKEEWRKITKEIERVQAILNSLSIKHLHMEGEGIDLKVGIGKNRTWMGGSGRNIPSFEIFISPDWRKTEGEIYFNQPLYRYGNLIQDVKLIFKDGRVVKATASKGQAILRDMIASENADKIGEFSLTDGRLSRITRVMGETLYDENMGGKQGNTHLALGNAYQDSYPGDPSTVSEQEWEEMGYNVSPVHTDIVSTARRKVTAYLEDGSKKVIYKDGKFTV